MRKRPLCCFCMLFLMLQIIFLRGFGLGKDLMPSLLEKSVKDGSVSTIAGKVFHTEVKKENLIVYLTTIRYQTKIIVYIKQNYSRNEQIHIGNEIKVTGEVTYFDAPRNPGNFDQKFYYQKQGIHGCMWASSYEIINRKKDKWKDALAKLRILWKQQLVAVLGEEDGNTMSAILLGDRSELDAELKEVYQKTGIGHILAISGLHMTFIGLGLYKLLRKCGCSFVSAGIIGILFLSSYAMMIGNGVASVRALVMFIVRIGADMTGRVYDMLSALALAAIVILLWRPLYLYDAGFLLSFGAILGILLIHPVFQISHDKGDGCGTKLRKKIMEGLWGSISINLMILPCMLYFYYEFPPYSLVINLLVIPLMSIILGGGMLGSALFCVFPVFGKAVMLSCRPILSLYDQMCGVCLRLPGSRLVIGQPKLWQILIYYIVLCMILISCYWKKDRKIYAFSGVFLTVSLLLLCVRWGEVFEAQKQLSVTMLDVGQGDGIVIQEKGGPVCLIDGGSSDVSEVGKYRIEPYLKSQGIGRIHYAFVSHGDSDHYNGVAEMLQRQQFGVQVENLVLPPKELWDDKLKALAKIGMKNDVKVLAIHADKMLGREEKNRLKLTCIAPTADYDGEIGNASSVVLSLSYEEFDMLFTGDVEGEGEEMMTRKLEQRKGKGKEGNSNYEVLKVAHHGSKNSSNQEFLDQVNPVIALISAGQNNRYGHPHQDTIQKLNQMDCRIVNTQDCGAIRIVTDGRDMKLQTFLH